MLLHPTRFSEKEFQLFNTLLVKTNFLTSSLAFLLNIFGRTYSTILMKLNVLFTGDMFLCTSYRKCMEVSESISGDKFATGSRINALTVRPHFLRGVTPKNLVMFYCRSTHVVC